MQKRFRFWVIALIIVLIGFLPIEASEALPSAEIVIHMPGSGSRVISPIDIAASITLGTDDLIRITLVDQRRNLLSRQLLCLDPDQISSSLFLTELAFEIPTESTDALLTLETKDEYDRPLSLRGVQLTLNTVGEINLETQALDEPWLLIDVPAPLSIHRGGVLNVKGIITPISLKPIIFELITDSGGLIGTKQLSVENVGEVFPFEISMSYGFINTTRDVRLVIRQTIDPFGVDVALDSIPIFLAP